MQITFTVPIGTAEPQKYLAATPEYALTSMEDEAAVFELRTSFTPLQNLKIQRLEHEIAGGLSEYLDLQIGIERITTSIRNQVNKALWPGGLPEDPSPEDAEEQQQQFGAHLATLDTGETRALSELRDMMDRVAFLAAWPTAVITCPPGWETLHEKVMSPYVIGWMRNAYATAAAADIAGKLPPSA